MIETILVSIYYEEVATKVSVHLQYTIFRSINGFKGSSCCLAKTLNIKRSKIALKSMQKR